MNSFRIKIAGLILISLLACSRKYANPDKSIMDGWKFMPGDSLAYAAADFNDSQWRSLLTDRYWEAQGYEMLDGFAWYRIRFVIPSSIKDSSFLRDSLCLFLGKINNFDQTFLNGKLIGINGKNAEANARADSSFTRADMMLWNFPRRYTLSINDSSIEWDRENVLSIRVFDEGGLGGLWTGDQAIRMARLQDYIQLDFKANPYELNGMQTKKSFIIKNASTSYTVKAKLKISATGKLDGKKVIEDEHQVNLPAGAEFPYTIDLKSTDHSMIVKYSIQLAQCADTIEYTEETPYILTPGAPENPLINCVAVYGARPGKEFLFTIAASGIRPITFSATGLPEGLHLNSQSGVISGKVSEKGEYVIELRAENSKGNDIKKLKLVIGDILSLTPPMGWNSWNCWGITVDQEKIIKSARALMDKGLVDYGWSYVNIDDGWQIKGDSNEPKRDKQGNIIVNEKFPDMKLLGNQLHELGLRFGIYSSPGPLTCGGYTGSYKHELQDARTYASWGVDYLKYDWCSYDAIARDTSLAEMQKPYYVMQQALSHVSRDIVYSLCQYGMGDVWKWGKAVGGNLWRTTEDITDNWESMSGIGFQQKSNASFAGPGHWNDPDMMVIGVVGWGPNLHPSNLTPDEQYTHMSLWCLLSAPLLLGCDLDKLDNFTISLLTNREVLAIDQDPLGKQAAPVRIEKRLQVWTKEMADGTKAIGIFNLGEQFASCTLDFEGLNLKGEIILRDVWKQADLGTFEKSASFVVPSHGVILLKTVK